jgi:hypothetical protein
MKLRALGLAIAAAAITGLTATAAVADEPAKIDVVVNVIDSSVTAPENPNPTGGAEVPADDPTTDPSQDPTTNPSDDPTTGTSDDPTDERTTEDEESGPLALTGGGFIGSDPLLVAAALSGLAAAGLIIAGVRRKRDGKAFLPKAGLAAIGAAGLLTVGSLATFAAESTTGQLVITIDKANTMNGTLDLAYQLDEPMTYMALNGTATANPDITLSVDGNELDAEIERQLLVSENPEGTDTIPYVLTATIDPNTPVGEYPTTLNVSAADLRGEIIVTFAAENKTYDGNTDAVVSANYSAEINMDDDVQVDIDPELAGTFAQQDAADNIDVTVDPSLVTLSGEQAHRYYLTLVQPTANITQKELTLANLPALTKVYDGTTDLDEDDADVALDALSLTGADLFDGLVPGYDGVSLDNITFTPAGYNSKDTWDADRVTASIGGSQLAGQDAANYTLASETVEFPAVITPSEVTVSWPEGISKVFDGYVCDGPGNTLWLMENPTFDGLVPDDGVEGHLLFATAPVYNSPLVAEATSAITFAYAELVGDDTRNYTMQLVQEVELPASITPKQLTWGATPIISKEYDGDASLTPANQDYIAMYLNGALGTPLYGLVDGYDNVTLTAAEPTFIGYDSADVATASKATISLGPDAVLDGPNASNYLLPAGAPEFPAEITAKPLEFTADVYSGPGPVTKVYDGTDELTAANREQAAAWAESLELVGLNGEQITLAVDTVDGNYSGTTPNPMGLAAIQFTYHLEGEGAGNYTAPTWLADNGSYVQGSISPKELTIDLSAVTLSKVYDGNGMLTEANIETLESAFTLSGVLTGDTADVNVDATVSGYYDSPNVLDVDLAYLNATLELTGSAAGNYSIESQWNGTTSASITERPVWMVGDPITKVFDGTTDLTDANRDVISGVHFEDADGAEVTGLGIFYFGVGVGYYDSATVEDATKATIISSTADWDSNNELVSNVFEVAATITRKPIDADFSQPPISKVYDGTNALTEANIETLESAWTLDGVLPQDTADVLLDATVSGYYDSPNVLDVDLAYLNATLELTGSAAGNYSVESAKSVFTEAEITKRPIWPTADPISKVFDGTNGLMAGNINTLTGFRFKDADGADVGGSKTYTTIDGYYDAATVAGATKATITVVGLALLSDTAANNELMSSTFEVKATITPKPLDYSVMMFVLDWNKPYNGQPDTEGVHVIEDYFDLSADGDVRDKAGVVGGYENVTLGYNLAAIPAEQELLKRGVGGPDEGCRINQAIVGPEGFFLTGDDASNYSVSSVGIDTECWITAPVAPAPLGEQVSTKPLPIVSETPSVEKEKVTDEAVESTEAAVEPTEEAKLDPPVVEGKQEDTDVEDLDEDGTEPEDTDPEPDDDGAN